MFSTTMSKDATKAVFLSVYIITFLISFPISLLAFCCCIRKIRSKPIPIDIFMLNLVISDLIFLTFLPVKMKEAADNMIWNMPYILCYFNLFMFFLPIYNSIQFLSAISVERYVCVAFPVKYKSQKRITYTILVSVAIWMSSIVFAVFTYKAVYTSSNIKENIDNQTRCYSDFNQKQLCNLLKVRLAAVVLFFCLPFIICCFCYINAIRILLKLPLIKRHRRLRTIGLLVGTLLVFAISFAPYNASHIVGYIRQEDPKWRINALMVTTLNTCFDPIIFYCISWEMRRAFQVCVKGICRFYDCLKRLLLLS